MVNGSDVLLFSLKTFLLFTYTFNTLGSSWLVCRLTGLPRRVSNKCDQEFAFAGHVGGRVKVPKAREKKKTHLFETDKQTKRTSMHPSHRNGASGFGASYLLLFPSLA